MSQVSTVVTPSALTPCVYVSQPGEITLQIDVVGPTFAGSTNVLQGSNDGTNWSNVQATPLGGGAPTSSLNPSNNTTTSWATQNLFWQYRVNPTALSSGSVTLRITGLFVPLSSVIATAAAQVGAGGEQFSSAGGKSTAAVAAGVGTAAVVVKASAGRLCRVLVTTVGTAAMSFYDNASAASGTVIGAIPASAAVGTLYSWDMPAANGIVAGQVNNSPAVTVSYY